ncbi:MAG: glycosyl transferase family 28 [Chitinophagaceae bacterium]|nr:MAG: glycosyl transferase family 28 [Chitinophagaceae bacterium]
MNGENINIADRPLRVLISPLDWGLGHASRIITIVKLLQNYGVQVLIAADGTPAELLRKEFPAVEILALEGYGIRYSRNKKYFSYKLFAQFPAIYRAIRRENSWLKTAIQEHSIDAIISDNRFGFYHSRIPSVYITHQLNIKTGKKWMNKLAQKIHYKYINRFTECWVPDFETGITLAGELSHPDNFPTVPVKYLGPISRFKKQVGAITNDLLIILSGPEPQRSIWERDLLNQVKKLDRNIVLVRGLPEALDEMPATSGLTVYNHLPAATLEPLIKTSAMILCRSGYSSVMDLVATGNKALLVPTPGQAEQEYLATYLMKEQLFFCCEQKDLMLETHLKLALEFPQKRLPNDFMPLNENVIKKWIKALKASI